MNTDRLIERLGGDVRPVRPLRQPVARAARWWLGAGVYGGILALVLTSSDDLAAHFADRRFFVQQAAAVAMSVSAAIAAFVSVIPGYSRRIFLLPAAAAVTWVATMIAGVPHEWQAVGPGAIADPHEWRCALMIAGAACPSAVALALSLRRGAPLTPRLTSGLGALTAAALTNVVTCLAHPHPSGLATLVWHGSTLLALVVLAVWIGPHVLTWKRPGGDSRWRDTNPERRRQHQR